MKKANEVIEQFALDLSVVQWRVNQYIANSRATGRDKLKLNNLSGRMSRTKLIARTFGLTELQADNERWRADGVRADMARAGELDAPLTDLEIVRLLMAHEEFLSEPFAQFFFRFISHKFLILCGS